MPRPPLTRLSISPRAQLLVALAPSLLPALPLPKLERRPTRLVLRGDVFEGLPASCSFSPQPARPE